MSRYAAPSSAVLRCALAPRPLSQRLDVCSPPVHWTALYAQTQRTASRAPLSTIAAAAAFSRPSHVRTAPAPAHHPLHTVTATPRPQSCPPLPSVTAAAQAAWSRHASTRSYRALRRSRGGDRRNKSSVTDGPPKSAVNGRLSATGTVNAAAAAQSRPGQGQGNTQPEPSLNPQQAQPSPNNQQAQSPPPPTSNPPPSAAKHDDPHGLLDRLPQILINHE